MCFADFFIILGTFLTAFYFRFELDVFETLALAETPPFIGYLKAGTILSIFWTANLWRAGGYGTRFNQLQNFSLEFRSVLFTGFISLSALMIISFMYRPLLLSRIVYVSSYVLAGTFLLLYRFAVRIIKNKLTEKGIVGSRTLVLCGESDLSRCADVVKRIGLKKNEIVGYAICESDDYQLCTITPFVNRLNYDTDLNGGIEGLYSAARFDRVLVMDDDLVFGKKDRENMVLVSFLNYCEEKKIAIYYTPYQSDILVRKDEVGSYLGVPIMRLRDSAIHPVYTIIKRGMDIGIALIVLLLGLPFWLIIAALIKLTSKGPVFYVQERAGLYGRPFRMYKFRSMIDNADQQLKKLVDFDRLSEPVFNIRKDPRITRIGAFLRRTSLDEIPQLLNVLAGQMTIVGPRPERVELVEKYNAWQRRRLKSKPGITGYQQVVSRGDPSLAKRIEYDLFYLKYQGLWMDCVIMMRTFWVIIRGDGFK